MFLGLVPLNRKRALPQNRTFVASAAFCKKGSFETFAAGCPNGSFEMGYWSNSFFNATLFSMKTTTLDIHNLLVAAEIEREKAEPLAKEILSRDDAAKTLATKEDISDIKDQMRSGIMWVAGLLIGQIAISTAIINILFQVYTA